MRRFNRTPCYTGPDDPEMGQLRGVLELGGNRYHRNCRWRG